MINLILTIVGIIFIAIFAFALFGALITGILGLVDNKFGTHFLAENEK